MASNRFSINAQERATSRDARTDRTYYRTEPAHKFNTVTWITCDDGDQRNSGQNNTTKLVKFIQMFIYLIGGKDSGGNKASY